MSKEGRDKIQLLVNRFGALQLDYIDGRTWRVVHAMVYKSRTHGFIWVARGFLTDFASIPRFFWRILPPTGQYGKAAVVHDWLYFTGAYPRNVCDHLFLEAMEDLDVGWFTRRAMYRAVRMFGGGAWNRQRGNTQDA